MNCACDLTFTRDERTQDAPQGRPVAALSCKSDPFAIRDALWRLRAALTGDGIDEESVGTAELVLAEVLTNIGKHAYGFDAPGTIQIWIWQCDRELLCRISDRGARMPGGHVPGGQTTPLEDRLDDLPEGGFGWPLIHEIASQILYCRDGDHNRLTFKLPHAHLADRRS